MLPAVQKFSSGTVLFALLFHTSSFLFTLSFGGPYPTGGQYEAGTAFRGSQCVRGGPAARAGSTTAGVCVSICLAMLQQVCTCLLRRASVGTLVGLARTICLYTVYSVAWYMYSMVYSIQCSMVYVYSVVWYP